MEIYVRPSKREYGFYVMPILRGYTFIGRIDPAMNRKTGEFVVKAICAEPDSPKGAVREVFGEIEELADFVGARTIKYETKHIPKIWKS